jgi:hypothetical protein
MTNAYSLSWTTGEAARRLRIYRTLFGWSIATNLVVCFLALFFPYALAHLTGQPDPFPDGWPRVWGATLLGLHIVYIPGWRHPLRYRWPNWCSIGIKFWMTTVFLFQGWTFILFAIWDFAWGVVLLLAYYRLLLADTARRP